MQSIPFMLLVTVLAVGAGAWAYNRVHEAQLRRRNRWGIAVRHLTGVSNAATLTDSLFGVFFSGLYYVYFAVLRSGMSIFQCRETADGATMTMASEPSVRCSAADPVYAALLPLSVMSIGVYGVGIPLVFGCVLYIYRREIRADQRLRAVALGDSADENPQLFVRRRFQKLYGDFSSDFFYWRIVLIARKSLLVICSVLFARCVPRVPGGAVLVSVLYISCVCVRRLSARACVARASYLI